MNKLILKVIGNRILPALNLVILASSSSCSSPRFYGFEIENESDFPMTLHYLEDGEKRWLDIPAGDREKIFEMTGTRANRDLGNSFLSIAGLDSLQLTVDPDSIRVTKELSLRENWEFGGFLNSLEDDGVEPYVFRIDNDDLE